MTKLYFVDEIKRLQEIFGKSHFNQQRCERIWHHCEYLENHQFNNICTFFIDNDIKPGVSNFRAKALNFKTHVPKEHVSETKCKPCMDTGIAVVKDKAGQILAMLCECGQERDWPLPKYDKMFQRINMPFRDLHPGEENPKLYLERKKIKFKKFINDSLEYWGCDDNSI